jgi:uncharacterized protein YqfB (UPF0267 family)
MIQLDFPQRLHFREASSVVYPKEIFYTIYDIQLWTLANGTIWQAVFVLDNGRRWRTIKIKELKKIDYDKLAEEQAQQDAYESGRVFF